MAKKRKKDSPGLISSAGLMRYMEAEDSILKLEPKTVLMIGVMVGLGILALNFQFGG
ncbi:preprotein translocase subunit Sec61beta [Methanosarcinales archaeon]|nr:MAG: preprotein translocase subunit Sec61beta [Methanosarcinales archaeon]